MERGYFNDVDRLKSTLALTSRALGMFAEIEMQRLEGEIDTQNPLVYVESKLDTAIYYVMKPTKDGKWIDPSKPYTND